MKTRNMMMLTMAMALLSLAIPASAQTDDRWGMFNRSEVMAESRDANTWAFQLSSACISPDGRCGEKSADFGGIYFRAREANLTFVSIYSLSVDYQPIRGAGPRFRIWIDTDGDGKLNGSVGIAFSATSEFGEAPAGWQRSGNLMNNAQVSFDLSKFGGSQNATYAEAIELIGQARVVEVMLVADEGWKSPGGQEVLVRNVQVNDYSISARNFARLLNRKVTQ